MATCEYGQIAGGECGPSVDNPSNSNSVVIAKCTKDIQGHQRAYDVRDASLDSEPKLLLVRAVPDILKSIRFDCQFSPGGFVRASQENSKKPCLDEMFEEQENNSDTVEDSSVLFSCPNEGCVKVYQRYSSLEKHMSFGKCKMLPEKGTLLDKAKKSYHILLQEDVSSAKALETTDGGSTLTRGTAAKLRNAVATTDEDIRAVEVEQEFCDARQVVLDDVQLRHPIVYDNLNLCDMHKKGRMKALSIAMLKTVCEFFGVSTDGFIATRKAKFLFSLEEIVKGCSCCSK
ncbi:hypothetical protein ACROYT_G039598 [Oculina patagonica]